jgi:hypothetical protein
VNSFTSVYSSSSSPRLDQLRGDTRDLRYCRTNQTAM